MFCHNNQNVVLNPNQLLSFEISVFWRTTISLTQMASSARTPAEEAADRARREREIIRQL
jgi:hypothetical protein